MDLVLRSCWPLLLLMTISAPEMQHFNLSLARNGFDVPVTPCQELQSSHFNLLGSICIYIHIIYNITSFHSAQIDDRNTRRDMLEHGCAFSACGRSSGAKRKIRPC